MWFWTRGTLRRSRPQSDLSDAESWPMWQRMAWSSELRAAPAIRELRELTCYRKTQIEARRLRSNVRRRSFRRRDQAHVGRLQSPDPVGPRDDRSA